MTDALYCRFNSRGRKQFKASTRANLLERFPEYASIGLPAHKAALEGNVDGLREIFSTSTDDGVPSRDRNGATPLHLAVKSNRVEAVKWMLRYTDLSPLVTAKHGETPAHVAAVLGNTECLKVLLAAEDVKTGLSLTTDNSGFTPLHLAVVKYRNDCAKVLIAELGVRGVGVINESGITAAHVAASSGNVDVLKVLAQKHKRLLSYEAADGTTPVYFAAQEGRLEAFKFLHVKGKCDVTLPSHDGLKPIHAACQGGHTNIVKYLVSCFGNSAIFNLTPDGATPLHFAASAGMVKTALWLINSDVGGTLIHAKDKNGDTPGHDAAENGRTDALKVLLESGADLYAINAEGNTPYSLAVSGQHSEMANYVMAYASRSPQKPEEGPSRMTIYDLKGDVDAVVDFGAPVVHPPTRTPTHAPTEAAEAAGDKGKGKQPTPSKKERKKSKKEEKKAAKKGSGTSFLGQSNPTFQSFKTGSSPSKKKSPKDAIASEEDMLEMTDSELALFREGPKSLIDERPGATGQAESDEASDIVVSYSDAANHEEQGPLSMAGGAGYATVNEIALSEERKEKKKVRKTSKSLQKVLKPGQVADSEEMQPPEDGFGGAMGFRPSFRSNPLQHMNIEVRTPPTPPPTPATGAGSSAPSASDDYDVAFETAPNMLDTDDDVDDNPYDVYAEPDREVVKQKALKRQKMKEEERESENRKLLEDALIDLSDEESPPSLPDRKTSSSEDEDPGTAKVTKMWPPPPEPAEKLHAEVHGKSGGANKDVLKRWPPATSPQQDTKVEATSSEKPRMRLAAKWMPKVEADEDEEGEQGGQPMEPTPSAPPPEPMAPAELPLAPSPDTKRALAVHLRSVKQEGNAPNTQRTETEFSKVKLKKASDMAQRVYFSSPDKETTSGATSELKDKLSKRKFD